MSGKFNFSNLRRLKEVKVKRPARPFSALTSLIPMHALPLQTIHSLPTRTNTLPAFILPSDHTRIYPLAAASSLRHRNPFSEPAPQRKVCFHPGPPSWRVFFKGLLMSPVTNSRQSSPFCEGTSHPGMWSGHLWTKGHSCSRSSCLLILKEEQMCWR